MIFSGHIFLDGGGNSEEVGHVDFIANIGVKVVLEVLKHVHVFLYVLISSDSWERESFIEELPCMNLKFWSGSGFLGKSVSEVHYIGPVSRIKSSGEHIDLIVKFSLRFIEINAWWVFQFDRLSNRDQTYENQGNGREFH